MTKRKSNLKKGLIAASLLSSLSAGYYATGSYLFNRYAKVDKSYADHDMSEMFPDSDTYHQYTAKLKENIAWFKAAKSNKVQIHSFDGLLLEGVRVTDNNPDNPLMILLHGYNSDRYALLNQAHEFSAMGFNLLMIDQRSWGKSEGVYTTFGFKESLDLLSWITYLRSEKPDVDIALYGVSMGASTIMKTLGYVLPANVKLAIVDSGYTSLKDLIECQLKTNVLTPAIAVKIKRVLGFDIGEIDCKAALAKNEVPILFLHAKEDKTTPSSMASELYEANFGPKAIQFFDKGSHAINCFANGYYDVIADFITKYFH